VQRIISAGDHHGVIYRVGRVYGKGIEGRGHSKFSYRSKFDPVPSSALKENWLNDEKKE
jgi:hypothetical protein